MVATSETYATIPSHADRPIAAPRKSLLATLQLLAKCGERRTSLAVLADLLLTVRDGRQRISATDLNCSITHWFPAGDLAGINAITVNAKTLTDIVKSATGADVILTRSGAGISVTSGGSDATILGTNLARDYPKVPAMPETLATVDAPAMAEALERCLHAVCKDETRFHLNGVLIEGRGNHLTAVSTDGHRLIKMAAPIHGAVTGTCILPSKAATLLAAILRKCDSVKAAIVKPHLHVRGVTKDGACWEASFKTIDAQFPQYEQVIPKEHSKLVTVDRKALIAAMKRAKALCSATRGALLRVGGGKLTIVADHPDNGSTSEALKAESAWVEAGGELRIGVNATYLIEALDEIPCKHVTLSFGGEMDPMLVRGTDDQTEHSVANARQIEVIMPMRI